MEDSNRVRRRILAFLIAEGGRVSSGQNDNLVAWMYRKMGLARYQHKQVTSLNTIVLPEMEAAGLIVLERSERGRLVAVRLSDNSSIDIDEEDRDLFDSQEAIWLLVASLIKRNRWLEVQLASTNEAFEELAQDATPSVSPDQLITETNQPRLTLETAVSCDHEQEIARLREQHAAQLAHVSEESRLLLDKVKAEFAAYRQRVKIRFGKVGEEKAALTQQLREIKQLLMLPDEVLDQLRSIVRHRKDVA